MKKATRNMGTADVWDGDHFGRKADAEFLRDFLVGRSDELAHSKVEKSFVLNIDANWGEGKSFFLKRFKHQLEQDGYPTAYVDAWKNDFVEDPLTVVMAAIDDEVRKHTSPGSQAGMAWTNAMKMGGKVASIVAKGAAARAASAVLTATFADLLIKTLGDFKADGLQKPIENLAVDTVEAATKLLDQRSEANVSDYRAAQDSIAKFRASLDSFIVGFSRDSLKSPFFVFVDELDRCRPPFAIAMLERIKHLFNLPSVVFIVGTATGQLSEAVKAIYGSGFDATRYLNRFFDRTYLFDKPDKAQFVAALLDRYPIDEGLLAAPLDLPPREFMARYYFEVDVQARTIEQMYDLLRTILSAWTEPMPVQLAIMLPLIHAYHSDPGSFNPHLTSIVSVVGIPESWTVSYRHSDEYGVSRAADIQMKSIVDDLWAAASRDLNEAWQRSGTNKHQRWINGVFAQEVGKKYGGNVSRGRVSKLAEYPHIVRRAGRVMVEPNAAE